MPLSYAVPMPAAYHDRGDAPAHESEIYRQLARIAAVFPFLGEAAHVR